MRKSRAKNLLVAFILLCGTCFLMSCTKIQKSAGNEPEKKPTEDSDGDDGTLPPVNIAGTYLTCGPLEDNQQNEDGSLYGCTFFQDGEKSKETIDKWDIVIIGPDGQEITITEYNDADAGSKWNVIFSVPPEFIGKMFEVHGTVTLHGSTQSIVSSSCPAGYILVPGDEFYGTEGFCVMKYEAKIGKNSAGKKIPVSSVDGNFFVGLDVTWKMARRLCQSIGPDYSLINNEQWLTIAVNIAQNKTNWQGNEIGSGEINQGHSDGFPYNLLNATVDETPCFGTWNQNCTDKENSDWTQKRTHQLSNNEIIWDLAGNVEEWVDMVEVDSKSEHLNIFKQFDTLNSDNTSLDIEDIVPRANTHPWWEDSWNSDQGIGMFISSPIGGAFRRGGAYSNLLDEEYEIGIFYLNNGRAQNNNEENSEIGFRCVVKNKK